MKEKQDFSEHNSRRMITIILLSVLLIILLTSLAASKFVGQIRANVRSTTVQVISELTSSKVKILNGILEEARTDTNVLAEHLSVKQDEETQREMLDAFRRGHGWNAVAMLDARGKYLYGSEEELTLKGIPEDFTAEVLTYGTAMSDAIPCAKGKRCILFGSLLTNGGQVYVAIPVDELQDACGESTFHNEGYSYVLERDGDIMIPPVRYNYEQIYGNVKYLLGVEARNAEDLDGFMEAMAAGKTGSVVFYLEGQAQLLCFEPLDTEKHWQFVTVVPLAAVEKDGAQTIWLAMVMAILIVTAIALILMLGVFLYIVMQRKQQENDRFLRNIYQAISENTDTVIFILDAMNSRLDFVFENSGRLLGIPSQEFLKWESGNGGSFKEHIMALLREQRPAQGCEQELHSYNDRLQKDMWLKILICPFLLGKSAKYIFAITDVTEEHSAKEKITTAVIAAEQANAAKSNFLANMSHDMRTPMNGIVGMVAIARKQIENKERVLDCLDKIDVSSKHLLGLINDVLDMSRIESGKLVLLNEPFHLEQLILGLKTMIQPQCDARGQQLTLSLDIKHCAVIGDTVRLVQILMNLLSNAVKFTPEGGMITVLVEELKQKHTAFCAYRFTVIDNGIGMSPEFQKMIFTPFERAKDAMVSKSEGTGLGMSITKNLVSAMGGQIIVESQLGKGSTFIVELELPLQTSEAYQQDIEEVLPDHSFDFRGKRFLLAEDNEINREIAVELLRECGAQIETVQNGQQAVEEFLNAASGYFDAVLMDIQMPVMNGYEATRAIRASNHSQALDIPIIAMTANAFDEDVRAALDAGMNAHIAKPFDVNILYKTLDSCL